MANQGHDVNDLKKVIRECAHQMLEIIGERKELNERAGDIRKRLTEAGVQTKAFDFAVRVREMEKEAQTDYLESLQINFEALSIGAQSEMFREAASVAGNGADKAIGQTAPECRRPEAGARSPQPAARSGGPRCHRPVSCARTAAPGRSGRS